MSFNVTDLLLLLLCKRIQSEPMKVTEKERRKQRLDKKERTIGGDVGVGSESDVKAPTAIFHE